MAPSRGFQSISSQCRVIAKHIYSARDFSTATAVWSGHNRWSKIKHDKGKNDAAKNRQRSIFAHELATASKLYGPDPTTNGRLAEIISKAKREGFAKASIESAIARGQGRSTSGAILENITIEGLLPNNVAVIIDCETESKLRTLSDVRLVIKQSGGTASPTNYLFEKRGRIVFERKEELTSVDLLDAALDAGATDVDDLPDGRIVVLTEPEQTRSVGDALVEQQGLEVATSGMAWIPNSDTMVEVTSNNVAQDICDFVDALHDKESNVQGLALNIARGTVDDELWNEVQARISP